MHTNIRWQQRFQNFEKAYWVLKRRVDEYEKDTGNEAYRMALIQAFEVAMELSWKLLKDYLANEGTVVNSPKQLLRQAYQFNIIDDGEGWLSALEKRNLTTHTYYEDIFNEVLLFIVEKFAKISEKLYLSLKKEIN